MKLVTKLFLVFLVLTLFPLVIVGFLSFENGRRAIEQHVFNHLISTNLLKENEFELWLLTNQRSLRGLARRPLVREYSEIIVSEDYEPDDSMYQEIYDKLIIDHFAPTLEEEGGYLGLSILRASDGLIVISTDQSLEGKYRESEKFFLEGRSRTYVDAITYSITSAEFEMHISTPIQDANGNHIAVIAGNADLSEMTGIMTQRSELSASEDTYLVNKFNFFVTEPRFGHDYALKKATHTRGVESCLRGEDGTDIYPDYRDVLVFGAYHWLEDYELCLITEVNLVEAFAPIADLRNNIAGVGLILGLVVILLSVYYARSITKPVEKMIAGAEEIGRGNLDHRIPIKHLDELGLLAESFNKMTANLAASQNENAILIDELQSWSHELESRVEVRTRELNDAQTATLSMMEDVEEARRKAEEANQELKDAQIATMNIMMDVEQARRETEQANKFLQREKLYTDRVINSIPGIFYIFDAQGKFIRWNANFPEVPGYTDEEISRMHPTELFGNEDQALVAERIEQTFQTGESNVEAALVSKNGSELPYYFTGYRLDTDNGPILIGTGLDISERKKWENQLAEQAEELTRSNEDLEHFAYIASHDLQEPLRMVASYLQLLDRRYTDELDQDGKEFIAFAVNGATRMKRLINDLLAYSRVGTRGRPYAPTDINIILSQVQSSLQTSIDETGAQVSIERMPTIMADEPQMLQLFQNLLANAIKFRKNDQIPQIDIGVKETKSGWQFALSDNGIGIDPQFFDRIFVLFQRLHGKEKYSGTGIGLALSKRIVERHGGRIWVESERDQGSCFYFTIPNTPVDGA